MTNPCNLDPSPAVSVYRRGRCQWRLRRFCRGDGGVFEALYRHLSIGLHGALLLVVMVAIRAVAAAWGGFLTAGTLGVTWFGTISVPYSLWKYVVGLFNQLLGID
jgi:hypothetical protein